MLPRFEIRARVSISERRIPVQHATYGAFSITWPAAVQIHWNKRTEELNSHRTGSEQQNDRQCGSHAPGSEIVGTARLRKRDHENQTGGSPLFPDHVVIFSRVLHLPAPHYLRAWNRLPMWQTFQKMNTLYIYN